jgi:acetoin utilization deacetylase AcuC-like enzyme
LFGWGFCQFANLALLIQLTGMRLMAIDSVVHLGKGVTTAVARMSKDQSNPN